MFKLKDYFKLSINGGVLISNVYKPYINYDWSTTTTSGLRYLKDVGSTPTYNASMYFGRGAYFNGVDQTITVPINATIKTALKRVNGVVTINETSQILTNYVISGLGVHKDYYLFTRLLTTDEKDSYTNTPEAFYAMAKADSTCVLNMPICETDGYVRNMKSYSEVEKMTDPSFVSSYADVSGVYECTVAITNNALEISPTSDGGDAYIRFEKAVDIGSYVQIDIDIVNPDNSTIIYIGSTSGYYKIDLGAHYNKANGKHSFIVLATTKLINVQINEPTKLIANKIIVNSLSIKQLSGIYQITNYTTSVRDNAKNLQYGLQTCKFVRDGLGVIQSASDYLEGDTVGYADTGWVLQRSVGSFSIEFIQKHSNNGIFHISGRNESVTQRFYFGENGAGRSVVRYLNANQAYSDTASVSVGHTVISFDFDTNEMLVYFRGAYIGSYALTSFVDFSKSIILGAEGSTVEKLGEAIRLFKVHQKVLTQAEITANYNSYRAKGLLS